MISIIKTDYKNKDFVALVRQLDADLAIRDGDDHDFYHQFNHIEGLNHVVLLLENNIALACGAIKAFDSTSAEIKRMYTSPDSRGKGYASLILSELEKWAHELGFQKCILETGINQPEAISLYKKCGFHVLSENYGQYKDLDTSFCFEKLIRF